MAELVDAAGLNPAVPLGTWGFETLPEHRAKTDPQIGEETLINVRLTPRAGATSVALRDDGGLAVRVTAPPLEDRANEALVRAVAKALGVAPSRVALVRGRRSRDKTLRVEGLGADDVRRILGGE